MKTLLLSALGLFLFSNVHAAERESLFLPKDLNHCLDNIEFSYDFINKDRDELLGGGYYTNPFLGIEIAIYGNGLESTPCGKRILQFARFANLFYQDYGVYCVYGRKDGTEALNRLGHFTRQKQFTWCGL